MDGAAVVPAQEKDKVTLPAAVTADRNVEVVITYAGEPHPADAPMSRSDFTDGVGARVEDDGSLWTMQEPFGAFTWYPVNDHPSDEALYDIAVTVPEGWAGVANGHHMGKADNTTNTYLWHSDAPVASYVTTLAVDRYQLIEEKGPHDLPLTYWVPKKWADKWTPALKRSPELISWLEERYGPYPFDSLGVVLVGGGSAMETQQMVTFSGGLVDVGLDGENAEDHVVATLLHEYAHQWFGDSVTPTDWTGMWLNEGMATYAQAYWEEEHGGEGTAAERFQEWREQDGYLRVRYGPPGAYKRDEFGSGNVYYVTAVMFAELREELGGETFDPMMREWAQQRNTHQDRASFTAFVNEHAKRDMTGFIGEWLDSHTTPA